MPNKGIMQVWEPETQSTPQGSYLDAVMQGATLGFADEMGAMGAGIGRWIAGAPPHRVQQAREDELRRQRLRFDDIRNQDPYGVAALQILGALPAVASGIGLGYGGWSLFDD